MSSTFHQTFMETSGLAHGARSVFGDIAVRWIPPGRFVMGSPESERDRGWDEVQHEVVLTEGFFMAETQCTQRQWEAVMETNPSTSKGPDRPVDHVSWGEAVEHCRTLTIKQRACGILPARWEWRLPTEAEWEYTARAGTTSARYGMSPPSRFWWAGCLRGSYGRYKLERDDLNAIALWSGNSGDQVHPVKQKVPNAWGLHDMIGNVWEWCADWYGAYPTGSVLDPWGPQTGTVRVIRGGCSSCMIQQARSAHRSSGSISLRSSHLGFRPALSSVR